MRVGSQRHAPVVVTRKTDPPGPVRTGVENMAYTGIRSPDRPACRKSLHRLRYPDPHTT